MPLLPCGRCGTHRSASGAVRKIVFQPFPRTVLRAVVDNNDFLADIRQSPRDDAQNGAQRVAFVVDGNDDRQQHAGVCLDGRLEVVDTKCAATNMGIWDKQDPQDVEASLAKEAAEKACGKPLIAAGTVALQPFSLAIRVVNSREHGRIKVWEFRAPFSCCDTEDDRRR